MADRERAPMQDTWATRTIGELSVVRERGLTLEKVITDSPRGATVKVRGAGAAYAIKVARDPLTTPKRGNRSALIRREAALLRALADDCHHLYVTDGLHNERAWLMTRWLDGPNAATISHTIRTTKRGHEAKRAFIRLFVRLLQKTHVLHQRGYVHGDLQPSHFVLDGERVYLLDFELANPLSASPDHYTGALVHFVSPETAQTMLTHADTVPLDLLTDIYAAASVLFFLYTEQTSTPYGRDDNRRVPMDKKLELIARSNRTTFAQANAEPFPALERVLAWCLATNRRERCANLADAIGALQAIVV